MGSKRRQIRADRSHLFRKPDNILLAAKELSDRIKYAAFAAQPIGKLRNQPHSFKSIGGFLRADAADISSKRGQAGAQLGALFAESTKILLTKNSLHPAALCGN